MQGTAKPVTPHTPRRRQPSGALAPALTIQERFERLHQEHPEIYQEFERLADILLGKYRAGKIKWISAKAVWERMRSNFYWEGKDDSSEFKYSNDYTSRYARLLIEHRPEFEKVIRVEELKTK